jgi:Fe2+-dicitrate sensor, membrane component
MEITESSIQKFFDYQCGACDAFLIAQYLKENQEAYNPVLEREWNNSECVYVEAEEYFHIRQQVWHVVLKRKQNNLIRMAVSIAACAALLFSLNIFLARKENVKNTLAKNGIQNSGWNFRMNTSDNESYVRLEDGSDVRLQKNSFIKYQSLTQGNKRDVYLEGKAFFKVAKNKAKPFTVWASGITTTALGTQFSVAVNKSRIIIKLFEGKVVVKATHRLKGWKRKEIYLLPGTEFIYDSVSALFMVRPFKINDSPEKEKNTGAGAENMQAEVFKNANWYMFNNQPLVQVFKQLEEIYNVHIEYKERDFESVYFIGKFDKNDSVTDVLKNITLLKKLNLTQKGNTYIIKK